MTSVALMNSYQPFTRAVNTGASPEARNLQRTIEQMVCHFRDMVSRQPAFLQLAQLARDSQEHDWDGYEAKGMSYGTHVIGIRFLSALPTTLPTPHVAVDPDGELSFEWVSPEGRVFSVSANGSGRLSYAGVFADGVTTHGTEIFVDTVPATIMRAVERLGVAG